MTTYRGTRAAVLCFCMAMAFPAHAQTSNLTGKCEDIFVPHYPTEADRGTALEDIHLLPEDGFLKSAADCNSRARGIVPDSKAIAADARVRAMGGDKTVLPVLRKLADERLSEASFFIYFVYAVSPPLSPLSPERAILTRSEAERELRRAAEAGHRTAMMSLARGVLLGMVVKQDHAEARVWLKRAIDAYADRPDKRSEAALDLAALYQEDPASTDAEKASIPALAAIVATDPRGKGYAQWLEMRGRRLGIGWEKNGAAARAMAEIPGLIDSVPAARAEYFLLLKESNEPADRTKLAELLEDAKPTSRRTFDTTVGGMLYSGDPAGRDRKRALVFLQTEAEARHAAAISVAQQIIASGSNVKVPPGLMRRLYEAVELNLPDADITLVKLRASTASDMHDGAEVIGLEAFFGARNDAMALHLLGKTAKTGPQAYMRPYETKEKAVAALEGLISRNLPAAHRIKATALRQGTLYPQDDVAATRELIAGAEGGDVEAMKLLSDAYSDGKGIAESNAEEFRWITAAAQAGDVDAQRSLIFFMPFRRSYEDFNVHDALVSGIVLYADGLSSSGLPAGWDSVFIGPEMDRLGLDAIAAGVMGGFRASLAARTDETIVRIFKRLPKEVTLAIETVLKRDGAFASEPDGFMGPAARNALAAWARMKGLPVVEGGKPPAAAEADARLTGVPLIAPDVIAALRSKALDGIRSAKGKDAQKKAMQVVALLAQYGDMEPRIEIARDYSDSRLMQQVVAPGLAALYSLDVLITEPPGAEKVQINFIFTLANLMQNNEMGIAAQVVLMTLRDDPRFQKDSRFEKVSDQFIFVPGLCDALLDLAKQSGIVGVEQDDPCSASSRRALLAWARAAGPSGAEAKIRTKAAEALGKLPR